MEAGKVQESSRGCIGTLKTNTVTQARRSTRKSSVFIIMIHYDRSSCVANLLSVRAPLRELLLVEVSKLVDLSSVATGDTLGVLDKATNGSPP